MINSEAHYGSWTGVGSRGEGARAATSRALVAGPTTRDGAPVHAGAIEYASTPEGYAVRRLEQRSETISRYLDIAQAQNGRLLMPGGEGAAIDAGDGARALDLHRDLSKMMFFASDEVEAMRGNVATGSEAEHLLDTHRNFVIDARVDLGRSLQLGDPTTVGELRGLASRSMEYASHTRNLLDAFVGAAKIVR